MVFCGENQIISDNQLRSNNSVKELVRLMCQGKHQSNYTNKPNFTLLTTATNLN